MCALLQVANSPVGRSWGQEHQNAVRGNINTLGEDHERSLDPRRLGVLHPDQQVHALVLSLLLKRVIHPWSLFMHLSDLKCLCAAPTTPGTAATVSSVTAWWSYFSRKNGCINHSPPLTSFNATLSPNVFGS